MTIGLYTSRIIDNIIGIKEYIIGVIETGGNKVIGLKILNKEIRK